MKTPTPTSGEVENGGTTAAFYIFLSMNAGETYVSPSLFESVHKWKDRRPASVLFLKAPLGGGKASPIMPSEIDKTLRQIRALEGAAEKEGGAK